MVEFLYSLVLGLTAVLIDMRDKVLPVGIEMQLHLEKSLYLTSVLLLVVVFYSSNAFLVSIVHLAIVFNGFFDLYLVLFCLFFDLFDLVLLAYLLVHCCLH